MLIKQDKDGINAMYVSRVSKFSLREDTTVKLKKLHENVHWRKVFESSTEMSKHLFISNNIMLQRYYTSSVLNIVL